jgi:hypothetical protein
MKKQVYVNPKYSNQVNSKNNKTIAPKTKEEIDKDKEKEEAKQRGLEIHKQNEKNHQSFTDLQKQVNRLSNTAKKKLGINYKAYAPMHYIPDEVFFTDEVLDTSKSVQVKVDIVFVVINNITIILSKIVSIDADSRVVLIKLEGGNQEMIFTRDQLESDKIVSILHQAIRKISK